MMTFNIQCVGQGYQQIALIRRLLLIVLLLSLALPSHAAGKGMLYVKFRLIAKEIKQGSFAGKPKKVWLIGHRYLRLEEEPNPFTKIHGLIITRTPHTWLINRHTNRAKHILDPDPKGKVYVPLVHDSKWQYFKTFTMGREVAFFRQHKAKRLGSKKLGGVKCQYRRLSLDGYRLGLCTRQGDIPYQIDISNGKRRLSIRYLSYQKNLKPDMVLFQLPKGVKISEAKLKSK